MRFWPKVLKHPSDGCWEWQAAKDKGYGRFSASGYKFMVGAHIWAWEAHTGLTRPPGMELDHLCQNTSCVRPDHLELVPGGINKRRQNTRKTHCPKGHPYSGDNVYLRIHPTKGTQERRCRQCRRDDMRSRYRAAHEAPPATSAGGSA